MHAFPCTHFHISCQLGIGVYFNLCAKSYFDNYLLKLFAFRRQQFANRWYKHFVSHSHKPKLPGSHDHELLFCTETWAFSSAYFLNNFVKTLFVNTLCDWLFWNKAWALGRPRDNATYYCYISWSNICVHRSSTNKA